MKHLSEAMLNDLLTGKGVPESASHLSVCASCREELREFRAAMGMFNEATARWSEAKSNGLSRDLSGHKTPFRVSSGQAYSLASLVLLAVVGASTVAVKTYAPVASKAAGKTASAEMTASRQQEIASDNAMLKEIDSAVNAPVTSPMTVYGEAAKGEGRRGD